MRTITCLTLSCLTAGSLLVQAQAQAKRISDAALAGWMEKRVRDWQPTADERRFDDIGWVKDIREALRIGKETQRPIFLFTHDGRMAIGRC
jgi:hypothetical protein